ncbi:hypothetical protein HC031_22970 [Planosporangium thailandense]|uniref:Integral membrane protein n=1 Tax=Planosporangium thailandense TaxID=765197 RepID=A0ABX0Y3G1_9ACTN|nr:hypothetical protein [Planosporangium thailandense]NJC72558.1 hypothetical protein [Planosporangium thailandense]
MPFFIVFLVTPIAVAVALYRRNPRRFLDGPTEDAPLRLLRWAVSLLSPQRAEWGHAMLGELGHLDGRRRRMRFALGCAGAALILPPWGRAAVGLWAAIGITAASFTIYAGLTVHYQLGVGGWISLAVVLIICGGYLLGASALLRRPGIALPGLLGGVFATMVGLSMAGFTALDQVTFIPSPWQQWVRVIAVPAAIGAAGTLWRRDPAAGRRVARLAALSAGLLQLLYGTVAVAILGSGGPPDAAGGGTVGGTVNERLGNNFLDLLVGTLIIAMVGWAAAALAGYLLRRTPTPAAPLATDPVQEV